MKISCVYCGAMIDTYENNKCPTCGASFDDNKEYQEGKKFYDDYKRLMLKEKEARIERQKIENERAEESSVINNAAQVFSGVSKIFTGALKVIRSAFIIIFIGVLIAAIIGILAVVGIINSPELQEPSIDTTEQYEEPYHEAIAGEIVSTRDYQVILDKWGYYEPNSYAIKSGEKYIKFHFTYTNTSEQKIYDEEQIYCYDSNGNACNSQASISDKDKAEKLRPQFVMPNKSYSGWVYFCVPETETEVTLMYGEKIEIKLILDDDSDIFDPGPVVTQYNAEFGETIISKELEIVIDEWGYYEPEMIVGSGEKYIKMHVKYYNIGDNDFPINERVYCYDLNGAEYSSTSMFLQDGDKAQRIKEQDVAPGKSYSGYYYFEIPESISDLIVKPFKNVEIHVDLMEE